MHSQLIIILFAFIVVNIGNVFSQRNRNRWRSRIKDAGSHSGGGIPDGRVRLKIPQRVLGYKFIGCLVDNRARMLDVKHEDRQMTIQKCAKLCSEFSFFGVQYSRQCFCGNSRGNKRVYRRRRRRECNFACAGNRRQSCGGRWRNTVYCKQLHFSYNRIATSTCASGPCKNGAVCIAKANGYNCICPAGFTDEYCSTDIDECEANPCQNSATCKDEINGYKCTCPDGYTGTNCESVIKSCRYGYNNPCKNGGTCKEDSVIGYSCSCPTGFTGKDCEINIDECEPNPCKNSGTCKDEINGHKCTCPDGYTGTNCESEIHGCGFDNPCTNGGTCKDSVNGYSCLCPTGFAGKNCQINIDDCGYINPCKNGGTCNDEVNGYTCSCATGFYGKTCRAKIPCREPDSVMDATTTIDTLEVGGTVTYVCDFGYLMSSGDSILTCRIGPFWEGTLPTCSVIRCKITGLNDYTFPSTTSDVLPTTQVSFTCKVGYKLPNGDSGQRECKLGGRWTAPLPACEDIDECLKALRNRYK
ncbi:Neurogenic locus protein delta,Protein eyes shut homolog,Neurogenic locus Notch protein,Neurogenic locus notch homolog protein 3,Protein eyes shut,Protocadherin Fat 4,Delta and Notch-like epidermal growth factor-related receptor,Delta-like protein C,Protein slit,Neurogenic locus notch homolog protein 1,Fibropellin-3,Protein jagged-1a,Sushi, von Willebrand factor type A, EGF and pentraxin domain-containing protein 1,Protein jagged-2,Neurogenic locus notch homolog protein 2,Delta-like protein B,Protein crumb|uniref:Uncharacterized protein n=1 Tax=Mytilus coruscus TaxID=42192 RepID=A0A6J8C154_MYTCO|nr:Neurogenic locus protein delta,Protein eyes shut homolog,Neurogenic locus Notch protein,Neurogenic locus notch homolog protein 3,Protein eyes shut,Protocadherin Fat 4,Delta and Notch-like epidermal growth factor-related receptor,Delta-like protein C,Protein slit,Neurogenic locus notch homolog protein 1,Fibropellin-3,Protein jagged-1a,Sushi, von Willebrand factor type A, EGF and pentraxin domain-containing protein 1,Protein jagged-2,Neurogenic locus notch homolog protein 2,Delta-like protein B,Pr